MKTLKLLPVLAAGLLVAVLTSCSTSHPSSQVTLTGMMVCGKCKLHQVAECQNVLQVTENGTTQNYWLTQNDVSKDFHDNICKNDGEMTTVTGTVEEKNGQEQLTATTITPMAMK
jgi:Family of unknown function (DUF6370)